MSVNRKRSSSTQRHTGGRGHGRGLPLAVLILAAAIFAVGMPWAVADTGETPTANPPAACPKVILYYSRGSGQGSALNSPGIELYRALWKRYGHAAVGKRENHYPAVPVTFRAFGLKVPKLRLLQYRRSVGTGMNYERGGIGALVGYCPQTYLVLAGYSQGAQVTRQTLARLGAEERERVVAVVLFGDPYFNPNEHVVAYFPAGKRKRRGILVTPFNARSIRVPGEYKGQIFSWCHRGDLICQGLPARKGAHGNYRDDVPAAMHRIITLLRGKGIEPPARSYSYSVDGTCGFDTCALSKWSEPGESSESVGSVSEGEEVKVVCQTVGETVSGANGVSSDIWDELDDGAFVSDFYVDTPNIGKRSPPIPPC